MPNRQSAIVNRQSNGGRAMSGRPPRHVWYTTALMVTIYAPVSRPTRIRGPPGLVQPDEQAGKHKRSIKGV